MEKEKEKVVERQLTRAEAIEMGVLIDVSEEARKEGFHLPVAFSAAAWQKCIQGPVESKKFETIKERTRKTLAMLSVCHEMFGFPNPVDFPNIVRTKDKFYTEGELVAGCSLDEFGEPVVTVILPEER